MRSANCLRIACPVVSNLKYEKVMDGFESSRVMGLDSHQTAPPAGLVFIANGAPLLLHDGNARRLLAVDEHGHIEFIAAKH